MNWFSLDEMPELITTYARGEHFFGVVCKTISGSEKKYEFGVDQDGHHCMRKILDFRPFDNLPGIHYRYFFMNSIGKGCGDHVEHYAKVMIVQGTNQRSFEFKAPKTLISNLQWFLEAKNHVELSHLTVID